MKPLHTFSWKNTLESMNKNNVGSPVFSTCFVLFWYIVFHLAIWHIFVDLAGDEKWKQITKAINTVINN